MLYSLLGNASTTQTFTLTISAKTDIINNCWVVVMWRYRHITVTISDLTRHVSDDGINIIHKTHIVNSSSQPLNSFHMALRGDRVVQLRKSQSITQAQLAKLIDVGQNQISRYETGGYNPSIEKLILMAKCLNTTTDYLLGLSDIPHAGAPPDPPATLSPAERDIIEIIRRYDEDGKALFVQLLKLAEQINHREDTK